MLLSDQQGDEGQREVVLVAEAEVTGADAERNAQFGGAGVVFEYGAAMCVVTDTDVARTQTFPETEAHGLDGRLLGGEALGEELRLARRAFEIGALRFGEDTLHEALAEAVEIFLHARDADDVGADAVDHAAP